MVSEVNVWTEFKMWVRKSRLKQTFDVFIDRVRDNVLVNRIERITNSILISYFF